MTEYRWFKACFALSYVMLLTSTPAFLKVFCPTSACQNDDSKSAGLKMSIPIPRLDASVTQVMKCRSTIISTREGIISSREFVSKSLLAVSGASSWRPVGSAASTPTTTMPGSPGVRPARPSCWSMLITSAGQDCIRTYLSERILTPISSAVVPSTVKPSPSFSLSHCS